MKRVRLARVFWIGAAVVLAAAGQAVDARLEPGERLLLRRRADG